MEKDGCKDATGEKADESNGCHVSTVSEDVISG
jgi:hypothetical protein